MNITVIINNEEIWRKLFNSVAKKYDCGVSVEHNGISLYINGNPEIATAIQEELTNILSGKEIY